MQGVPLQIRPERLRERCSVAEAVGLCAVALGWQWIKATCKVQLKTKYTRILLNACTSSQAGTL